MARITVEDCIDKIPSRFDLVLIASHRARKLHTGDESEIEKENDKNTVVALREIETEKISLANIKESIIKEFQNISIFDNENEDDEENLTEDTLDPNQSFSNEIEKEIKSLESAEDKKLEEQYEIKDANQDLEENIALESAEDKKLEEQYEIKDANQDLEENIASDSHEEKKDY